MDLNHRSPKTMDLQSTAIDRSATHPYMVTRGGIEPTDAAVKGRSLDRLTNEPHNGAK